MQTVSTNKTLSTLRTVGTAITKHVGRNLNAYLLPLALGVPAAAGYYYHPLAFCGASIVSGFAMSYRLSHLNAPFYLFLTTAIVCGFASNALVQMSPIVDEVAKAEYTQQAFDRAVQEDVSTDIMAPVAKNILTSWGKSESIRITANQLCQSPEKTQMLVELNGDILPLYKAITVYGNVWKYDPTVPKIKLNTVCWPLEKRF